MDLICKYFPSLEQAKLDQLSALGPLFLEWNSKINLVSRQDAEHLYERHILHSLSIAKIIDFKPNTKIIDVGTGGGFPGIPLAILFPDSHFTLVDSIGKKIKATTDLALQLGLQNVTARQSRAEEITEAYDFVVARAVTGIPAFLAFTRHLVKPLGFNDLKNGFLYLKGGDLTEELTGLKYHYKIFEISALFGEPFFITKKIMHIYP